MEAKHLALLAAVLLAVPIGIVLAARDRRLRDACAFLLLLGVTRYSLVSINLMSREWYRGTTRGFEVCWLDLVCWILLGAELQTRSPTRRGPAPPSLHAMLLFVGYNALIVASSTPQLFGAFELSKMIRGIIVFVTVASYVKSERELRVLLWALAAGVIYEFFSACYWHFVLGWGRAPGSLVHANVLSMFNLIAVPILLAVWCSNTDRLLRSACGIAAILGSISILLSVSRTGVVTIGILLACVGLTCGSLRITARKAAVALSVLTIGGAVLSSTWASFEKRFDEDGGFEKEFEGKVYEGRGAYINLAYAIAAEEPWGCGLNNWSYWVSNRYGPRVLQYYARYPSTDARPPRKPRLRPHAHVDAPYAPPAHTLYGITLGETGWVGVILFGIVWLRWLQMTGSFLLRRDAGLVSRFGTGAFFGLVGAIAQSYTEWEFRFTPLFFLMHIVLGMVAAVYPARSAAR